MTPETTGSFAQSILCIETTSADDQGFDETQLECNFIRNPPDHNAQKPQDSNETGESEMKQEVKRGNSRQKCGKTMTQEIKHSMLSLAILATLTLMSCLIKTSSKKNHVITTVGSIESILDEKPTGEKDSEPGGIKKQASSQRDSARSRMLSLKHFLLTGTLINLIVLIVFLNSGTQVQACTCAFVSCVTQIYGGSSYDFGEFAEHLVTTTDYQADKFQLVGDCALCQTQYNNNIGFLDLQWSIGNSPGNWVTLSNTSCCPGSWKITISNPTTFTAGTHSWFVKLYDASNGKSDFWDYSVTLVSCSNQMAFSGGSTVSVSILGPANKATLETRTSAVCGAWTLTIPGAYSSLISASVYDSINRKWTLTISVKTLTAYAVGTYNIQLSAKRNDYPNQRKYIILTVYVTACVVTSIAAPSIALSTQVRVGIDVQPFLVSFSTTQTPACQYQLSFSIQPTANFLAVQTGSIMAGNVAVNGALISDHNTYSIILKAQVGSTQATRSFTLIIIDPCSESRFTIAPAPLHSMPVELASTITYTQTVKILTDIETSHPSIICPITAVLAPPQPFIRLSGDFATISVDGTVLTSLIPGSVKSHAFTLTVNSLTFSALVPQETYSFSIDVTCRVTQVNFEAGTISDKSYEIDPSQGLPMVIPMPTYTLIPCLTSASYSRQLQVDSVTLAALPSFISYSDSAGTISVLINTPTNTGTYKLKVVATESVSGIINEEIKFSLTLTCTTNYFFNSEVKVNNVAFKIPSNLNSKPVTMAFPVYKTNPDYCLLQPYSVVLIEDATNEVIDDANKSLSKPNFITKDDGAQTVTIYSIDPSITGKYIFRFVVTEPRFKFVDTTVSFAVSITCEIAGLVPVLTDATISNTIYVLRSSTASFEIPTYTYEPSTCATVLLVSLENQSQDAKEAFVFPKFFKFDIAKRSITLEGDSFEERDKEFKFRVIAMTADGFQMNDDFVFTVQTLFKNSPPAFKEPIQIQVVKVGESNSWKLPLASDSEGDEFEVNALITKKMPWLSFVNDNEIYEFAFDGEKATVNNTGQFKIPIRLTDKYGASLTISQVLFVINEPNDDEEETKEAIVEKATREELTSDLTATDQAIKEAKKEQEALIANTSSWDGWKVLLQKQFNDVAQRTSTMSPQMVKLKQISNLGIVLIEFSNPVKVPEEYRKSRVLLGQAKSAIAVFVKSGTPDEASKSPNFDWDISEFEKTHLEIQLTFENATSVSVGVSPEILVVQVVDPSFFADADGQNPVNFVIAQEIPRQIQLGSADQTVAEAANTVGDGVKSLVIGNFILNLFMTASLNQLWSVVEAQQTVVLIPMFSISIPPSSASLIDKYMQIASFDLVPVNWIWEKIFYLPPYQPLGLRFATVGVSDSSLINNIGSIFLMVIASILLFGLGSAIRKIRANKTVSIFRNLHAQAYWQFPLTLFLESYTVLAFACLLAIKYPNWASAGQTLETVLSYILIVLIIVLTALLPIIMMLHKDEVQTFPKSKHLWRYEPLYDELDLANNQLALFRFIFFLRRLLLAIAIVQVETLAFQLFLGFAQSILMIVCIGMMEPFSEKSKWRKEMLNEQIILSTIYFVMCFSDLVPDPNTQSVVGYAFCGILVLHIGFSLLVIAVYSIKQAISDYKRNRFIQQRKNEWNARWQPLRKIKSRLRARNFVQKQRAAFEESERKMINSLEHEQNQEFQPRPQNDESVNQSQKQKSKVMYTIVEEPEVSDSEFDFDQLQQQVSLFHLNPVPSLLSNVPVPQIEEEEINSESHRLPAYVQEAITALWEDAISEQEESQQSQRQLLQSHKVDVKKALPKIDELSAENQSRAFNAAKDLQAIDEQSEDNENVFGHVTVDQDYQQFAACFNIGINNNEEEKIRHTEKEAEPVKKYKWAIQTQARLKLGRNRNERLKK